jgi:hypothetical protein
VDHDVGPLRGEERGVAVVLREGGILVAPSGERRRGRVEARRFEDGGVSVGEP